jgi:hypothetical protein
LQYYSLVRRVLTSQNALDEDVDVVQGDLRNVATQTSNVLLERKTVTKEEQLENSIEKKLRLAGIDYLREPIVGSTKPDFFVTTVTGDQIVIEVKAWPATPENLLRASHQAKRYMELSKTAGALLIASNLATFWSAEGQKFTSLEINRAIATVLAARATGAKRTAAAKRDIRPNKRVFASMPFASRYDDTFLVAIQPAAIALNASADRIDHAGVAGDVVGQIKAMIKSAEVIVADLSESRPNVCHEVGYAQAAGRPVIQICSTDFSQLPFNFRNNQTIRYSIGQSARLKSRLQKELAKYL